MIKKSPPYRNPALLAAVEGMACVSCGRQDGTIIPAHYSGICSHKLGKGERVKAHDFVAALCAECHDAADNYRTGNNYEAGFHRLMQILQTLYALLRDEKIRIEVIK